MLAPLPSPRVHVYDASTYPLARLSRADQHASGVNRGQSPYTNPPTGVHCGAFTPSRVCPRESPLQVLAPVITGHVCPAPKILFGDAWGHLLDMVAENRGAICCLCPPNLVIFGQMGLKICQEFIIIMCSTGVTCIGGGARGTALQQQ